MFDFFYEVYQFGWLIFGTLVNCIVIITVLPLIVWVFVIPKIEKRMGKKLTFSRMYDFIFLGKYLMGSLEVGIDIGLMYLSWKIFKNKTFLKCRKDDALILAKYDVEHASNTELITGFICFLCMFLFLVAMFLMFLIPHLYPLH